MSDRIHDAFVALEGARAEVERLQAALIHEIRVAINFQRQRDEASARLALTGMKVFDAEWRDILRTVAERQREACANFVRLWRLDPKVGAIAWHSEDAVRATPLVTDDTEQLQRIGQQTTGQT